MPKLTAHAAAQEQRIIEALKNGPLCDYGIGEAIGMGRTGVIHYTKRMIKARPKRIFICGYRYPERGGAVRRLYAVGDQPDVAHNPKYPKMPIKGINRKAARLERIVEVMATPGTAKEIAAACHLAVCTLHDYLVLLRAQDGPGVFVKKWVQRGARNAWVPVYALGRRKDAKHPPMQTRAERYALERSKPENVKRHQDNQKRGRLMASLKNKPQTIFAALGL